MALPTPGVTPANWGAQLNAEVLAAQSLGSMPVGSYVMLSQDQNAFQNIPKGTELSWPFAFPGPTTARLDRVCFRLNGLSSDVGTIIRFGVRADNAGLPGSVLVETSIPAESSGGGSSGWKELTVDLACCAVYWLSICQQGSGSSLINLQVASAQGPYSMGGHGASRASMDWAAGHGPLLASVANTSGTLASAGPPTGATTRSFGGTDQMPVFAARRGT